MKNLSESILFKIAIIVFIAILLLIPTNMLKDLIHEREATQNIAIREVSAKWGEKQTLVGPFLTIPYNLLGTYPTKKDTLGNDIASWEDLQILPEELKIDGQVLPEKRYRGIYEIVVYNSKIKVSGKFNPLDFETYQIPSNRFNFQKATFTIGISDLRGIEEQVNLKWNDTTTLFNPGVPNQDVAVSGINAPVEISPDDDGGYQFSFELDLKGSQILNFTPVGKVTDIALKSPWKNPSFNGAFLPDNREISEAGFLANWKILHLNRNFPQYWKGSGYRVANSAFGVDLLIPVDNYQKSYRSIRYAILFIGFTFLVFFFIEVLHKIFIHPIQYILVGIALVVFYTLLLSLSEQMVFNLAFGLSAGGTLLLISGYVMAILKSFKLAVLLSGILLILYLFIFVIIQLQDYALLIGSLGIFLILALVMYFSKDINWYDILKRPEKEIPEIKI
jgi:inner membrane protein